jgi:hypothetical protein
MTKIAGSAFASDPDPNPDPDPLVRGMDPRIQIRIHTEMSWIRNTGYLLDLEQLPGGDGLPAPSPRLPPASRSRLLHKLTFQNADRPLQILPSKRVLRQNVA